MSNGISSSSCRILLVTLAILTFLAGNVLSQATAARPDRGVNPGGAYSVSDIENINLENGNVNLSIPLASLPPIAGGKLKLTINAIYNSKLWDMLRTEKEGRALPYRTYSVDTPMLSDAGGWRIGGAYNLTIRSARDEVFYQDPPSPDPNDSAAVAEWQRLQYNWYKVVLQTPDGAEHELRPTGNHEMYVGLDHPRTYMWGYIKDTPDSTGVPMQYYSTDGTYLSAIVNPTAAIGSVRSTVFLPDGTQVITYVGAGQRIRDNNGNAIRIYSDPEFTTHYQDEQTGREIKTVYDSSGNGGEGQWHVLYQTVGGVWESVEINFGHTTVRGKLYRVQDWNAAWQSETGEQGVECTRHQELPPTDVSVVREIVFPNTEPAGPRKFTFAYDSDATVTASTPNVFFECGGARETYTREASIGMGALSHVVTTSGAIVDYTYSLATTHAFIGLDGADEMVKETLATKTLNHDGVADLWTYHIVNAGFSSSSSVDNPDGSTSTQRFYAIDPGFGRSIGSDDPRAGLVYYTSNALTETYRHWNMRSTQLATGSNHSTAFNSFVDAEYTSFVGTSLMSAKTYQYDFNNNLLQVKEFDWFDSTQVSRDGEGVPSGVPTGATLLRTTDTSYYNSAADTASPNYYVTRSLASGVPSILNAPRESTTGPSITRLSYDGQAFDTPPIAGNVTRQSSWDDLDSKWITSTQTYGAYGNLATKTDARGKLTQFFYDDAIHAAPNRIVVDPENGSGQQTMTTAFDFSTGLVVRQTDANGKVSDIDYTNQLLGSVDPFGRPGIVLGPVININGLDQRHRTTTTYVDHLLQVIVASDLNGEDDKLLKTRSTSDMLGRVILSEQTEDGTNYTISSHKVYQQTGKITYSSNPSYSLATTDGWTRATADNFGRMKEVATFGSTSQPPAPDPSPSPSPCPSEAGVTGYSGKVCTSYDANFTTVTDQAGRQRRSKVDALGRLVRVDEPGDPTDNNSLGASGAPAQPTSYIYDVLGNLTTVTQGAQTRRFTYDSLSRLRSASNPESGTVSYSYDDNGNLSQKIDARGVVSSYSYDALNRNISVVYTNDPAGTPAVSRYYDGFRDGVNKNIPNSKGRLWQTETAGPAGSRTTVNSFDVLGRPASQSQQFYTNSAWSQSFTVQRTYNLAGLVLAQTYPSGHTVSYAYDQAGRTSSFAGTLGDDTQRTYASEFQYTASSAVQQERLGTDTALYHKQRYNDRGQLWDMRVSTVPFATDPTDGNRGAIVNYYSNNFTPGVSGLDNNGNLLRQETSIPGSGYFQDNFAYDALNRLTSVAEKLNGTGSNSFKQAYSYDRFGNRRLDQTNTSGAGINNLQVAIDPDTNRLYAAGDPNHTQVDYDAAGNQTKDQASASSARTYDAENRMISAPGDDGASTYTYDGDGHRVRRYVGGEETATWQIYGITGELLAEYNGVDNDPSSLRKEYGYRNGQLLITVEAPLRGVWCDHCVGGGTSQGHDAVILWLVTDQLGTPRMIFDKTGSLAGVKRHDYLPFGEEIFADSGGRTTTMGYTGATDRVRQKFTLKERDIETGLDFFGARYYSNVQGRFTSADPGPFVVADPQNWNRYAYTINNPLKFTDPTGRSLSLNGEAADDFVDYLQRRSGLSLVRDAKTGKVTIAKGSKRNENGTSKEFAKLLKDVIGDSAKVGYTVKNDAGSGILFDDGDAAEKSHGQSGVIDFGDVKNADAQASDLATTVVGHVLYEGLRLATKQSDGSDTSFTGDISFGLSDARAGAHVNALAYEAKIMSGFTGQKEKLAERRTVDYAKTGVMNFIYTSVQYDVTLKTQSASNPNSVTVDKISKTQPMRAPQYPPGP
jgi:RHS repeat-associated protein